MLISSLAAFGLTLVYASFLEWFVHRYGMHTDRISKWAFKRHAIQHHAQRRSLKAFYAHSRYEILESSAVPMLWLAHVPVYWLTATLWNVWAGVGVALAALVYMLAYEFLHFFIHTPRNYWFQRTRLFHFYCEYHRVHHHKARWNYNVVCPLADAVLGTLSMAQMPPEPSAPASVPRHTGPLSVFGRDGGPAASDADPEEEDLPVLEPAGSRRG